MAFNRDHGIVPKTVCKPIREKVTEVTDSRHIPKSEIPNRMIELDAEMKKAAERLDFERAIQLRDAIRKLEREIGSR
jgi:excinuclease ABC subunit B